MVDVWLYNTLSPYLTESNIVCSDEKYYYVKAVLVNGFSHIVKFIWNTNPSVMVLRESSWQFWS